MHVEEQTTKKKLATPPLFMHWLQVDQMLLLVMCYNTTNK